MPKPAEVITHWHHSVEYFSTSTLDFYAAIESALAAKQSPVRFERIEYHESGVLSAKREYLRVSYGRYSFDVGAGPFGTDFFFSWWLVRRLPENSLAIGCMALAAIPVLFTVLVSMAGMMMGFMLFLVALAAGFIWVVRDATSGSGAIEDVILGFPVIGSLYTRFIRPTTYYSVDSRTMFQEMVHRVVLEIVSNLFTVAKLPALTPEQATPEARSAGAMPPRPAPSMPPPVTPPVTPPPVPA